MKLVDLGVLDAPVMLFGGPYSNLQATQALFHQAEVRGVAPSHMICTGDVVAYGADPTATVALIRGTGCSVVAGNCEKQLASYELNCGCGFEEGSTCDQLSAGWYAHADQSIGAADRAWMAETPDMITFIHQGRTIAVIHGGATDISRFLWSSSPEADFLQEIEAIQSIALDTSCIIAGHCGMAFQRRFADIDWVNAGVIGMPPNNGAPHTEFAILSNGEFTFETLKYDWHAAESSMRAAGLTQGYHKALRSGYWPSEDVLPTDLRVSSRASG